MVVDARAGEELASGEGENPESSRCEAKKFGSILSVPPIVSTRLGAMFSIMTILPVGPFPIDLGSELGLVHSPSNSLSFFKSERSDTRVAVLLNSSNVVLENSGCLT